MYTWRKLTAPQRDEVLRLRRQCGYPWHSPPHFETDMPRCYHLNAACYDHAPLVGHSPERMAAFEETLLATLRDGSEEVRAWCVLPDHWHALCKTGDLKALVRIIGLLHGRSSRQWNQEESTQGRTCWFGCADRHMRSEAHYWATLNYIHHNPVHHGYVEQWQDWPYSSAAGWIEKVGVDDAQRLWQAFPILDYGKGWDEAGM